MKNLIALSLALTLCGCSHTYIKRDEAGITAKNTRFFWASEGIDIQYTGTNGVVAKAKIAKSNSAEGAVDLFKQGLELGKKAAGVP